MNQAIEARLEQQTENGDLGWREPESKPEPKPQDKPKRQRRSRFPTELVYHEGQAEPLKPDDAYPMDYERLAPHNQQAYLQNYNIYKQNYRAQFLRPALLKILDSIAFDPASNVSPRELEKAKKLFRIGLAHDEPYRSHYIAALKQAIGDDPGKFELFRSIMTSQRYGISTYNLYEEWTGEALAAEKPTLPDSIIGPVVSEVYHKKSIRDAAMTYSGFPEKDRAFLNDLMAGCRRQDWPALREVCTGHLLESFNKGWNVQRLKEYVPFNAIAVTISGSQPDRVRVRQELRTLHRQDAASNIRYEEQEVAALEEKLARAKTSLQRSKDYHQSLLPRPRARSAEPR